ncbi:MAG: DUF4190 domain-containing protein [Clostridia bacterium]|nr:DUF4190 domain-containing protein [Clostridia bacterium]
MAKTEYKFKCNKNVAENIIMQFLKANNYKELVTKDGKKYYKYSDALVAGFLEYEFQNDMVIIYAYIRSEKRPMPLDNSLIAVMAKSHYKDIIESLLKALSNSNTEILEKKGGESMEENEKKVEVPEVKEATEATEVKQETTNTYNEFAQESEKSKEGFAIAAFVISIVGLLLSCFGWALGVIVIILEYYFAIQGLKSKKKGLAITAIVLASLSLLINIISIIVSVMIG